MLASYLTDYDLAFQNLNRNVFKYKNYTKSSYQLTQCIQQKVSNGKVCRYDKDKLLNLTAEETALLSCSNVLK
jgi:hypothetical protein